MQQREAGDLAIGTAAPADAVRRPLGAAGRRLLDNLLAERERWPLWIPVFAGAGIGAYFWLTFEPPLAPALALAGLALLAAIAALRAQRFAAPAVAAAALTLGFAAAAVQSWYVAAPVLSYRLAAATVEGRLVAVEPLPEGTRLLIAPARIERVAAEGLPARVRITLKTDAGDLVPGAWVSLRAGLFPPSAPAMPGAYDFQRRAWFDRLGAVGYALSAPETIAAPEGAGPSPWRAGVEWLRATVTARIRAALPGDTGAIAAALVTGETHAIAKDEAGHFRDAGLAHILVIAGLHMGMVAAAAFFALRAGLALIPALALRHPTKKWAAAGALLIAFLYLLLSGATVPSRRAFVMTGLVLLAVLVDRLSLSARAVAYAALAIMLMMPEAAAGPSFQMSFAAVAGLVAFYEAMRPRLADWHAHAGMLRRCGLYLLGIAFTTLVTTVATMPFTIYHFNRFPLYSVVANALAVPVTGFWIMPWALIACLLMPLGAEGLALAPMGWGIGWVKAIAAGVTAWPGAVVTLPSMPAEGLILLALGGLWLCIWTRRWRWLGLAPIALGYASLLLVRPPDLLVAGEGGLVAVRAADGSYLLSRPRVDAFVRETWTRRGAGEEGEAWPETGASADGWLSCTRESCRYNARGHTVALIREADALRRDCAGADLVVSPVPAWRLCRGPLIIDSIDIRRKGAHAVWLDPGGIRIETVADWRGVRPWTRATERR
ncbi:MAG TPA: ComEC/Rec2 family competence protein [Stellaceae bacterium]|nr:ComEC/Rec2 family competence protein [Stellaceae bacterium]